MRLPATALRGSADTTFRRGLAWLILFLAPMYVATQAEAACNSDQQNRFSLTVPVVEMYDGVARITEVCVDTEVTLKATFSTPGLPAGDGATFSFTWKDGATVIGEEDKRVVAGGNEVVLNHTFTTPGVRTITFLYIGPPWPTESCEGEGTLDDVTVVKVDIDPGFLFTLDGVDSALLSADVEPEGLDNLAYTWTWSAPGGAGNNPQVDFSDPTESETIVQESHWFALPNHADDCAPTADYTITCSVEGDTFECSDSVTATVWLKPNPGNTTPPNLSGAPIIVPDVIEGDWKVDDKGSLARILAQVDISIPTTSQFYNKIEAHENQHKDDFDNGFDGHEFVTVEELWDRIKNIRGETSGECWQNYYDALQQYDADEEAEMDSLNRTLEQRAYAVSDGVAPLFYYTWNSWLEQNPE